MTKHDSQVDESSVGSPLLQGEILFEDDPPSFGNASVHVFLEDTTLADAPAKVVVQSVMQNISAQMLQGNRIPFTLFGSIPDTQASYTVRVLVDLDGDGETSRGDYVNSASYPVLTRGYPDRVVVRVKKIL